MIFIVNFELSKHAKQKKDFLGINVEEIKQVIIKGSKWKEDNTLHANMGGIEVVYKKFEYKIFVITVYYSD